jgi:hypothetical protein
MAWNEQQGQLMSMEEAQRIAAQYGHVAVRIGGPTVDVNNQDAALTGLWGVPSENGYIPIEQLAQQGRPPQQQGSWQGGGNPMSMSDQVRSQPPQPPAMQGPPPQPTGQPPAPSMGPAMNPWSLPPPQQSSSGPIVNTGPMQPGQGQWPAAFAPQGAQPQTVPNAPTAPPNYSTQAPPQPPPASMQSTPERTAQSRHYPYGANITSQGFPQAPQFQDWGLQQPPQTPYGGPTAGVLMQPYGQPNRPMVPTAPQPGMPAPFYWGR